MRVPGHGMRKILTLGRGDLLGWSALLANGGMTTTAIVTEDTKVIEFSTVELKLMCEQNRCLHWGTSLGSDPVSSFFTHHHQSDCIGILDLK